MTGSKTDQAVTFLQRFLQHGPQPVTKIFAEGQRIGLSESTLRTAKERLGIGKNRHSEDFGTGKGSWAWQLPSPKKTRRPQ